MSTSKHSGSCVCGDVRFEVEVDLGKGSRCNCTICAKLGATGAVVKPAAFTLLSPEAGLASFTRNAAFGHRYFCPRCHAYCFSRSDIPQLGGAIVSINLGCVDGFDPARAEIGHWDGRHDNWQGGMRATPWPIDATPA